MFSKKNLKVPTSISFNQPDITYHQGHQSKVQMPQSWCLVCMCSSRSLRPILWLGFCIPWPPLLRSYCWVKTRVFPGHLLIYCWVYHGLPHENPSDSDSPPVCLLKRRKKHSRLVPRGATDHDPSWDDFKPPGGAPARVVSPCFSEKPGEFTPKKNIRFCRFSRAFPRSWDPRGSTGWASEKICSSFDHVWNHQEDESNPMGFYGILGLFWFSKRFFLPPQSRSSACRSCISHGAAIGEDSDLESSAKSRRRRNSRMFRINPWWEIHYRFTWKYGKFIYKWVIFHCHAWLPEGTGI